MDVTAIKILNPETKKDGSIFNELKEHILYKPVVISTKKITHIFHISDIHIPINIGFKRKEEFLSVFERLYAKIKKLIKEDIYPLIVITGDLLQIKINLKPDTIIITRDFLLNLANIAPVILITGNHDMNENNLDETCTLSSIIHRLNKNIHYLYKSGLYQYGDYTFVVSSLKDGIFIKYENLIHIPNLNLDKIIKLYHGYIVGAETDSGFKVTKTSSSSSRFRSKSDFKGYPLVLLGDVHRQQNVRKDGTMAYAGSLLQLDCSESLNDHGFLLWDLEEKSYIFHRIKNDYGFIKLDISNGILLDKESLDLKLYPKYVCTLDQTTSTQYENLIKDFSKDAEFIKKEKAVSFSIPICKSEDLQIGIEKEYQLIKQFQPVFYKELIELHQNLQIKNYNQIQNGTWNLIKLEFQNVFSFGNNIKNILEFEKGITNIRAPNYTGKSSICRAIMFALFGQIEFENCKLDILNKKSDKGFISLEFCYNNSDYLITKIITKCKKKGENYVTEFKRKDKKIIVNLEGSTSTETVKNIQQYVGTFENFIENNAFLTRLNRSILHNKPNERIKNFLTLFDLDKYNEYVDNVKEMQKNNNKILLTAKNNLEIYSNKLAYIKDSYQNLDKNKLNDKLKIYIDNLSLLDEKIKQIKNQLKKLDKVKIACSEESVEDLEEMKSKITIGEEPETSIDVLKHNIKNLLKILGTNLKSNIDDLKHKLETSFSTQFEPNLISKLKDEYNKLSGELIFREKNLNTKDLHLHYSEKDENLSLTDLIFMIKELKSELVTLSISKKEIDSKLAKLPTFNDKIELSKEELLLKISYLKSKLHTDIKKTGTFTKSDILPELKKLHDIPFLEERYSKEDKKDIEKEMGSLKKTEINSTKLKLELISIVEKTGKSETISFPLKLLKDVITVLDNENFSLCKIKYDKICHSLYISDLEEENKMMTIFNNDVENKIKILQNIEIEEEIKIYDNKIHKSSTPNNSMLPNLFK